MADNKELERKEKDLNKMADVLGELSWQLLLATNTLLWETDEKRAAMEVELRKCR
jgi:hypothetical protein